VAVVGVDSGGEAEPFKHFEPSFVVYWIMLVHTLKTVFLRDLEKVKKEIEQYQQEQNIWKTAEGISNSGGNLCLHLVGNLNTYIGAELGKSGYIRHRDLEFSLKDIPRRELLIKIDGTLEVVGSTFDQLTDQQLAEDYPAPVLEGNVTTEFFLVHLAMHLSYHLGQINYHRRLLDK
jgi:Protein of unknown function (DUF1572)